MAEEQRVHTHLSGIQLHNPRSRHQTVHQGGMQGATQSCAPPYSVVHARKGENLGFRSPLASLWVDISTIRHGKEQLSKNRHLIRVLKLRHLGLDFQKG